MEITKDKKQLMYGVILGVLLLGVCVFLILNDDKVIEKSLGGVRAEGITEGVGEISNLIINETMIKEIREKDSIVISGDMTKEYNSVNKTVRISDLDGVVMELSLVSPYEMWVAKGNSVLVAEFYLKEIREGESFFDEIYSYNSNDEFKYIDKNYTFKYGIDYEEEECNYEKIIEKQECEINIKTKWIDFKSISELPNKSIKIGMFANTEDDGKVEWVITKSGFNILEWAQYNIIPVGYYYDINPPYSVENALNVFVSGDYAYVVSDPDYELTRFNISNHHNPVPLNSIRQSSAFFGAESIFVSEDYLYAISFDFSNLTVWNVTVKNSPPVFVGDYNDTDGDYSLEGGTYVYVSGDYAYTTSYTDDTLAVWNISAHGNPVPVGTITSNWLNGVYAVIVEGNYAYTIAYLNSSLAVWDISAHGNPVFLGGYSSLSGLNTLEGGRDLAVSGDYAYTLSGIDKTLSVWNISSHTNPVPLGGYYSDSGTYSLNGPLSVFVSGDYAYTLSGSDDTLAVWDISAHGNPVPLAGYTSNSGSYTVDLAYCVYVLDNYAYTVDASDNFVVFNVYYGNLEYPQFSNYWADNDSITGTGNGHFNVTVLSTNGTVILNLNGTNYTATNKSGNISVFNVTVAFTVSGKYNYKWSSYGNGTSHSFSSSNAYNYTVNSSGAVTCSPTLNQNWIISDTQICDSVEVTTGTGMINLLNTGYLYLKNGANVSCNELSFDGAGDKIFISNKANLSVS